MTKFTVEPEYVGRSCTAGRACTATVEPGDEWGENWTTDDEDGLYCADHNDHNPTSDNYSG